MGKIHRRARSGPKESRTAKNAKSAMRGSVKGTPKRPAPRSSPSPCPSVSARVGPCARGTTRSRRHKTSQPIPAFYEALFAAWGPQHWWPGDTPFEVMVGAVLTQNTNWANAEKAIANLKSENVLGPHSLLALSHERLAELLRPSGYLNVKARRLRAFLEFFVRETDGKECRWKEVPTMELRARLLAVNGLGRETADSILLYGLNREIFVIDAYTRRVLLRHLVIEGDEDYDELRALFERQLPRNAALYNEYHALLVRTGKYHCKPSARCEGCPLPAFPHDAARRV